MEIEEVIGTVCVGREKLLTVNECHEIVNCLKQLKKYKQMCEELENNNYDVWIATPGVFTNMHEFVDKLKQKYFPKFKTETIEDKLTKNEIKYMAHTVNKGGLNAR